MSPDTAPGSRGYSLLARLRVEPHPLGTGDKSFPFRWSLPGEPTGSRGTHLHRLRVSLQVLGVNAAHQPNTDAGPMLDAVVSTGEPLSIFPRWCRQLCAGCVIWTEPRHVYSPSNPPAIGGYPGPDGPDAWYFRDRHPFELGVIWAIAYDHDTPPRRLAPRPVVARFLTEPSPDIPEPVIGLQQSILTNRRLTRETTKHETTPPLRPEEWWLREVI